MGNINNIVIMLLKNIEKERVEFRLKVFLGSSLNDAGISFQILASPLERALEDPSPLPVADLQNSGVGKGRKGGGGGDSRCWGKARQSEHFKSYCMCHQFT